ncbi:hypothetical protein SAMN05216203_2316 [Marinobacter daqiaonensis]|uniref:Endonuclease/exonuclease/phosphatase domain-containing protein n=1 Tax=Marinobacter daqiaonensis TaxID=650891 RepID=A0A1I6IHG7_9GAMM|nr:ExeM/NucH family extracellular endonuclease [Marinobacter daqiaonensis]SFR66128.1 hypothetical protein SAMN05216203_2316 [Marinobacter daqiaonensis]
MLKTTAVLILLSLPAIVQGDACPEPHTPISDIQGSNDHSPMSGTVVAVEGIITLDVRQAGGFQGFYLQQSADHQDDNPETSEGLFIHTHFREGSQGDLVRVEGRVNEYYGLTGLTDVKNLAVCAHPGLPAPRPLAFPTDSRDLLEHLEGMVVALSEPLEVTDTWNLGKYGELALAPRHQFIPTQLERPGPGIATLYQQQELERLLVDDGHRKRAPRPVPYPPGGLSPDNPLRIGDRVHNLVGVMDFRFGDWRLQPLGTPEFETANPRQSAPERHPDANLRVASLNLGNLFNGDGSGGGFPSSRGAASSSQFRAQLGRIATQIKAIAPDILAVAELENDGYGADSTLVDLATALGPEWAFVETAARPGNDEIRNALLYRSDRVRPEGSPVLLDAGAFRRWHRPPVAQDFRLANGKQTLTLVAVHLKSKRCSKAPADQQDQGDGQGCYADARVEAARALAQWPKGVSRRLLVGDFNAYAREDPLEVLGKKGFTDLIRHFHGLRNATYRYHGRAGTLDYHLADELLMPHVLASHIWSANADEPRLWSYQEDRPPAGHEGMPWRASDHDPVITDLRLD